MKLRKALGATIFAISLVVAAAAAKSKDYRIVLVRYDATVAGSHLASGSYNVQWQEHSPAATVTFQRDSKNVATVEGKLVDRGTKCTSNQVVYSEGADGARKIQEIRFQGSSQVIQFE